MLIYRWSSAEWEPVLRWLILLGATLLGVAGARSYADSANDASRLATVESLVDRGTLIIDDSMFVRVPHDLIARYGAPYIPDEDNALLRDGTWDKLWIDGHYYSDKPPVLSIVMAGVYQLWLWCGGPMSTVRPDLFCRLMTASTAGLAYGVAVFCMFALGRQLRLSIGLALALTGSFALGSLALPYVRHVNSHIVLLAAAAALLLQLFRLSDALAEGRCARGRLALVGTLAGFAYTLDQGLGPMLLLCLAPLLLYRLRLRAAPLALVCISALPWLIAHHVLNYAIGGTLKPANAVAEYLNWPGSEFSPKNITGLFHHDVPGLIYYLLRSLFGRKGFINYNLPLFLTLIAFARVWRRLSAEMVFVLLWCVGSFLLYGIMSNNLSGSCLAVRWFVPLLVPLFCLLALLLRDHPSYRWDFCVLTGWGVVLGAEMWCYGGWYGNLVPLWLPLQITALLSWAVFRYRQRGRITLTAPEQAAAIGQAA